MVVAGMVGWMVHPTVNLNPIYIYIYVRVCVHIYTCRYLYRYIFIYDPHPAGMVVAGMVGWMGFRIGVEALLSMCVCVCVCV